MSLIKWKKDKEKQRVELVPERWTADQDPEDRITRVIIGSTFIVLFVITIIALYPATGLDAIIYWSVIGLFTRIYVPVLALIIGLIIYARLSPDLLPWVVYMDIDTKRVFRKLRMRKKREGIRYHFFMNGGYELLAHKDRAFKKGLTWYISGSYKLYYKGKLIYAQDPLKMELSKDEGQREIIRQLENKVGILDLALIKLAHTLRTVGLAPETTPDERDE